MTIAERRLCRLGEGANTPEHQSHPEGMGTNEYVQKQAQERVNQLTNRPLSFLGMLADAIGRYFSRGARPNAPAQDSTMAMPSGGVRPAQQILTRRVTPLTQSSAVQTPNLLEEYRKKAGTLPVMPVGQMPASQFEEKQKAVEELVQQQMQKTSGVEEQTKRDRDARETREWIEALPEDTRVLAERRDLPGGRCYVEYVVRVNQGQKRLVPRLEGMSETDVPPDIRSTGLVVPPADIAMARLSAGINIQYIAVQTGDIRLYETCEGRWARNTARSTPCLRVDTEWARHEKALAEIRTQAPSEDGARRLEQIRVFILQTGWSEQETPLEYRSLIASIQARSSEVTKMLADWQPALRTLQAESAAKTEAVRKQAAGKEAQARERQWQLRRDETNKQWAVMQAAHAAGDALYPAKNLFDEAMMEEQQFLSGHMGTIFSERLERGDARIPPAEERERMRIRQNQILDWSRAISGWIVEGSRVAFPSLPRPDPAAEPEVPSVPAPSPAPRPEVIRDVVQDRWIADLTQFGMDVESARKAAPEASRTASQRTFLRFCLGNLIRHLDTRPTSVPRGPSDPARNYDQNALRIEFLRAQEFEGAWHQHTGESIVNVIENRVPADTVRFVLRGTVVTAFRKVGQGNEGANPFQYWERIGGTAADRITNPQAMDAERTLAQFRPRDLESIRSVQPNATVTDRDGHVWRYDGTAWSLATLTLTN